MIKLKNEACIDAPAEKVWSVLADLEAVGNWVEPIVSAHCDSEVSNGVGTSRVCKLSNGLSIKERWIAWDEGSSFEYETVGAAFIKRASNRWTVKLRNGKTLVTSEAEVELKGGFLSKPLELLMRPLMRAMGPRSLAALAYLVEHDKPYQGNHSKLPLAPITC